MVFKLILAVGITLLLIISAWAYFNIKYQKEKLMNFIRGLGYSAFDVHLLGINPTTPKTEVSAKLIL